MNAKVSSDTELASRGQRLGAALLDAIISMAWAIPIGFAFKTFPAPAQPVPESLMIMTGALYFGVFFLVHGYFLKQYGQTIGKKIVGIRIVDLNNYVPSLEKLIIVRYLPVWVITLMPVFGAFLPLIDVLFIFRSDRRCIHDLIANTKVIRVKEDRVAIAAVTTEPLGECPNCKSVIPLSSETCPKCEAQFTGYAVWKVTPL